MIKYFKALKMGNENCKNNKKNLMRVKDKK